MLEKLHKLRAEVIGKNFSCDDVQLFEGAGIVITDNPKLEVDKGYVTVRTSMARELSAVIFKLKEIFNNKLDYCNKYLFYESLAKAANKYLKSHSEDDGLLLAVIDEAIFLVKETKLMLYFAYGSNMNIIRMKTRCPESRIIGKARLDGYKFALDSKSKATILESPNDYVLGIVWEITERDKRELDKAEGVSTSCYKPAEIIVEMDGKK